VNKNILNTGAQDFILKNLNADIVSVLLKNALFDKISNKELVEQIEAKNKCKKKIPTWFNTPKIYFPNKLNIEQTSSEITAQYKSQIVSGKSLIDLTGGFGIDSYFFSKKIDDVIHNEIDHNLSEIATYNFKILGSKNISNTAFDAINFLKNSKQYFDWIYIDPSRRNDKKEKVFILENCLPDVTSNMNLLFDRAENILIKTAPLLDITMGIRSLQFVKEVHIVAVNNEVKELLWVLKNGHVDDIEVKTINFTKSSNETFNFKLTDEKASISTYQGAQKYLYEPNAAILKSGGFKIIGNNLSLNKIGEHTHLYTSEHLIDFPGRCFKIDKVVPYKKSSLKDLQIKKANITTRNFPISVEAIRKKSKIKDGGNIYLFYIKNNDEMHQILVCYKV
jgi:hypothetical protein